MPFVTHERMLTQIWTPQACDVMGGQATFRVNAWGVTLEKRLRVAVAAPKQVDGGVKSVRELEAGHWEFVEALKDSDPEF